MNTRALLICPLHPAREKLIEVVRQTGATHVIAASVREAATALKSGSFDVIISGRKLEDGNSDDLLDAAHATQPGVPVIVVSRTGDWEEYIEAINRGAFDLLAADSPPSESVRIISSALRLSGNSRAEEPGAEIRDKFPRGNSS
jgi:DNA-binding NtrC family response regulator